MDFLSPLLGLLQMVAPALVDGFGVKVKVVRCEPCVDRHLLTDSIDVDPVLVQRLRSLAPFSNAMLDTALTAAQLEEAVRDIDISAELAEGAFRDISVRMGELLSWQAHMGNLEQKQRFLTELLSSHPPIVLKAIVAGIRHGQPLTVPSEAELGSGEAGRIAEVRSAPEASGGFILRFPTAEFPISTGRPEETPKLESAVRALSYFHVPSIHQLLGQANDRLASFHLDKDAINLVRQRLLACQPLLVEVFVANGRKLPVALRSEARLFVRGHKWSGEAEVALRTGCPANRWRIPPLHRTSRGSSTRVAAGCSSTCPPAEWPRWWTAFPGSPSSISTDGASSFGGRIARTANPRGSAASSEFPHLMQLCRRP